MKRLWIAATILLCMLGGTLANSWYLNRLVSTLDQQLAAAHVLACQDSWDTASRITQQAAEQWQAHDFYVHIMLPHRDLDEISLTLREVQEYLALEETDQYTAANAKLMAQLGLLAEMEQLTVKNIL